MKKLVYYCRWNNLRLRLQGREEGIIRGQLVTNAPDRTEDTKEFYYDTVKSELTIIDESGAQTTVLDEMGIPKE